jgi:hypothetical protein
VNAFGEHIRLLQEANSSHSYLYQLTVLRCAERLPLDMADRSVKNPHSRPCRHNLCLQTTYTICKLTYAVVSHFCSVYGTHVLYLLLNLSHKPDNANCLSLCRRYLYICAAGGGKGNYFPGMILKETFIFYLSSTIYRHANI